MAFPIGAAIAAGTQLAGGFLGARSAESAKDAAAANFSAQQKFQEDLAQYGIRWRVEDAKAAGLHPLAALGAQVSSFSPIPVNFDADYSMANAVSAAGQDISRAVDATRTKPQRMTSQYERSVMALDLQKRRLEVEALAVDVARGRQALNPPFPSQFAPMLLPGQGDSVAPGVGFPSAGVGTGSGIVEDLAAPRYGMNPADPGKEGFSKPDVGYLQHTTADGRTVYVPSRSKGAEDALEDDIIGGFGHAWRNQILPMLGDLAPPFAAPPGYTWKWDYDAFGYYLDKNKFKEQPDGSWKLNLREER